MGKKQNTKKEDEKPVKIFTLDTETRGLFGEIFRVGLYDGRRYFAANSFNEIKTTLNKYIIKYDCHVFIHNLDFDLAKMVKDILPDSDLKNSIFINNNVTVFRAMSVTNQGSEENEIISQPITFHDSNKIILGRLKKICKDFGIEEQKAKIDLTDHIKELGWARNSKGEPALNDSEYDEFESEGYYFMNVDPFERQLNEYLRNDCVSLYEVVTTLIDLSGLSVRNFLKCPTTASLSMRIFKSNYPEDYEKACSTNYYGEWGEFLEKFIRDSYCGGRTEVYLPVLRNGYHYDVNSLYPYVMKTYPVPIGKPSYYKGDKARNIFKYWFNYGQGAGFMECDIFIPDMFIPPLPVKRMNKLIFPVGNIKGTWTFEELKLALELGCKIKNIHQVVFFDKTEFIFKDFIEYFEYMKTHSKGAKRQFSKLIQNSLYGKFGMRRYRKTLLPISEKEKCEAKGYEYVEYYNPLFNDDFIEAEIPSHAEYIQPHIAAHITSLARIELYRGMMAQHQKGKVAYCDTDSIVCSELMNNDQVHDSDYGKWKLEGELLEGIFLQPKTYYELHTDGEEVKKFKGIPTRYIKSITRDTYQDILNKSKELQYKVKAGIPIKRRNKNKGIKGDDFYLIYKGEKKRVKFATSLKNGTDDFDKQINLEKGINLLNMQKRQMDYINETSKPHKLIEWED